MFLFFGLAKGSAFFTFMGFSLGQEKSFGRPKAPDFNQP